MQILIYVLKYGLIFLILGSILLYLAQEKLIFHPSSISSQTLRKYSEHEITIKNGSTLLHGWLIKNKDISAQKPLIIYYGGNAEEVSANIDDINLFPAADFLFMNYRGYGRSQGKPSKTSLQEDALLIFDHIIKEYDFRPENIILFGRSLGSGIAAYVASQRDIAAIILITPYDSLLNIAKEQYPIFPVKFLLRHNFEPVSLAPAINKPMLAIMAEKDRVIAHHHSENLIDNWQGHVTSYTIKGASHNDINSFPEYWTMIGQFITNQVEQKK